MIKIGEKLPDAVFFVPGAGGPKQMSTSEVFTGKTVALFAVPGAFTSTCSVQHLPTFLDKADALKACGVDLIACTAVNDQAVLGAWAKDRSAGETILMLADGNGDFARAVGLELDLTRLGMGMRSRRYSMLVVDGVVQQLNVEGPGEFKVSGAEHLLSQMG